MGELGSQMGENAHKFGLVEIPPSPPGPILYSPETWVTERTYDIGDNLGPKGLSTGCKVLCSRSI